MKRTPKCDTGTVDWSPATGSSGRLIFCAMKFTAARGFSHTRVGGRLGHTAHAIGPLASACWWGDEFSLAAPWRPGRERGLPHILAGLAGGACAGAAG